MKTKNENQFDGRNFNTAWLKDALLIIAMFLLLAYSAPLLAQDSNELRIYEAKSFFSNLRTREQNAAARYSNAKHIEDLLSKVQPSVYCYSGSVKSYGEKPVCLFTNVKSLGRMAGVEILKNNIEMATIRIESATDLNASIDLNLFAEFKNMKYIQILSTVPATEQIINNMVRNHDGKYSVFFKVKKGDSEQ